MPQNFIKTFLSDLITYHLSPYLLINSTLEIHVSLNTTIFLYLWTSDYCISSTQNPLYHHSCKWKMTSHISDSRNCKMTANIYLVLTVCLGEGNGNPLQCSCQENPMDGGAW